MRQLRNTWFIALKELRLFVTDRMALLFAIIFPFFFVTLFNFVMAGIGSQDSKLELYVLTREPEGISHQIVQALVTPEGLEPPPGVPVIKQLSDYDGARRMVEDKEIGGFLAFPPDFTKGVFLGYGTNLEVVSNPETANTSAALNGLAEGIAAEVGAQQVAARAIVGLLIEKGDLEDGGFQEIGRIMQELFARQPAGQNTSLITFATEKVGEVERENPVNYVIPGYLVMFVFFTAALSAERIVKERQNHTLERLLASSVSRESLLGGIYLGTVFKGLVQISIFWLAGVFVYNIDLGIAPAASILLSVLVILMSAAFGLLLATLVKTERAASAIGVLTSLLLAPLGGCWWPLFITPQWMQNLALVTPHGWATTGFNKLMLYGASFEAAVPQMLALVVFGVVFAILAMVRFRTSAV